MTTPQISEFSYGFALTNEIVAWAPLKIAPVFPSLIQEGKAGGGWDLMLDTPGVPLYLQFKRSFRMTRRSANEIKKYKKRLAIPFHRFHITDSGTSDQHMMLLELDDGMNQVYYAAPRFDRTAEINAAWAAKEVAERSIFVRPLVIGELDDESHHIAFDATRTYICSEPKEIDALSAAQLVERLKGRLKEDPRPLRETAAAFLSDANAAMERAQVRIRERGVHKQSRPFVFTASTRLGQSAAYRAAAGSTRAMARRGVPFRAQPRDSRPGRQGVPHLGPAAGHRPTRYGVTLVVDGDAIHAGPAIYLAAAAIDHRHCADPGRRRA